MTIHTQFITNGFYLLLRSKPVCCIFQNVSLVYLIMEIFQNWLKVIWSSDLNNRLVINKINIKITISDRPSLANYDLLHKYSKSVAMYIYHARCHFKHLPLGYFLSHLFGCAILIAELFAMDVVLNYELSGRNFKIFDSAC